jgi:hypothetical protein
MAARPPVGPVGAPNPRCGTQVRSFWRQDTQNCAQPPVAKKLSQFRHPPDVGGDEAVRVSGRRAVSVPVAREAT